MRVAASLVALCLSANIIGHGMASTESQATTRPVAADSPAADVLRVVLLGSASGPPVDLQRFGASTLIEAGGVRLLFDCGRGATLRLAQANVALGSINRLFLTHLHSDHVMQIPDLLLTGWLVGGRTGPLQVWGPRGTVAMMDRLQEAFTFDIHMRRDVDEHIPAEGIKVESHDIEEGVVFEDGGVKVTAFAVDHGPVVPAFGYRIDYRGRSVALSGDTRVSENLIKVAAGVDVLVHEVVDPDAVRARARDQKTADAIIGHHTTPEGAAGVFNRVKPRLAVYSHAPSDERIVARTRASYAGSIHGAEDLLTIDIGNEIIVRDRDGKVWK